jgi:tryptophanase
VPKEEFPAQTLTIELYLEAGIRGCEIGYLLADRDPITRENRFNGLDLLRLAIPRRVYTSTKQKLDEENDKWLELSEQLEEAKSNLE